jgi:hypothetical protein
LTQLQADSPALPLRLGLDLSSNEQYTVIFDRREGGGSMRSRWRGRIEGRPGSYVLLALSRGVLAGSLLVPGSGAFQIQPAGDGWLRVIRNAGGPVPPCGVKDDEAHLAFSGAPAPGLGALTFSAAAGEPPTNAVLDLLVVYTAAARDGAGGTDAMNAIIDVAVSEANLAFENSLVNARLQLVHRAEIDYNETGDINRDLDNLDDDNEERLSDNGPIRGVHTLRRQYLADLVCLIIENTGGPLGLANVMHEVEAEFSEKAFSVVQRQFLNSYFVMAHEIGHNLGCQHDRASSTSDGCFEYSHAHLFLVEGVRYHTIMAYQPGLPVPHFSNPGVSFLGVPTGVPAGATNSADNARTINLTAATAARFSSILLTGTPPSLVLIWPTNGAVLTGSNVFFSVEAQDDGHIDEVAFYLDGLRLGQVERPPYELHLDTLAPGVHLLRVKAEDNTGWESGVSATFTVPAPPPELDAAGSGLLPDGRFRLRASCQTPYDFRIDVSSNLVDWVPVLTNRFSDGLFELVDVAATNSPVRFYRIELLP